MASARCVLVAVFLALACCTPGLAAAGEHPAWWGFTHQQPPDDYGTDDLNLHFVSGVEFICENGDSCDWKHIGNGYWSNTGPTSLGSVMAPLRLPSGALLTGITVAYRDDSASGEIFVKVIRDWFAPTGVGTTDIVWWVSSGTPGYDSQYADVDPDHTVTTVDPQTEMGSYAVFVQIPNSTQLRLRAVIAHWSRQVNPAPASATFGDVPTGHWAFRHVEALAASGITAGCGGGNFCPDASLTRAQMAVFLAKALGLHWAP